jgi:hypothetical protein
MGAAFAVNRGRCAEGKALRVLSDIYRDDLADLKLLGVDRKTWMNSLSGPYVKNRLVDARTSVITPYERLFDAPPSSTTYGPLAAQWTPYGPKRTARNGILAA